MTNKGFIFAFVCLCLLVVTVVTRFYDWLIISWLLVVANIMVFINVSDIHHCWPLAMSIIVMKLFKQSTVH